MGADEEKVKCVLSTTIKFILKRVLFYVIVWFIAVNLDWILPRLTGVDPTKMIVMRIEQEYMGMGFTYQQIEPEIEAIARTVGLNQPIWVQYLDFWNNLLHGNLGVSVWLFPTPVNRIITMLLPYDAAIIIPVIITSWTLGNLLGAYLGFSRRGSLLDRALTGLFTALNYIPYYIFAMVLIMVFSLTLGWLPPTGNTLSVLPSLTWAYVRAFLYHWILPFSSIVVVDVVGWALSMRTLVLSEMRSGYAVYSELLGVKESRRRSYVFKNSILPQVTGLALWLGGFISAATIVEMIFNYPGLGWTLNNAISNFDYMLVMGVFIYIITLVLAANLVIDIIYGVIDPRVRAAMMEVG